MKNLVIVESPTKARTIGRFLGNDYEIKSSMGHVVDLPKSKLSVDIEHNFKPDFQQMVDKKKIIDELKAAAKHAKLIILATDPDREGEAIASHIAEILTMDDRRLRVGIEGRSSKIEKKINPQSSTLKNLPSTVHHPPSISRIVFHEITKEAIEGALKNPRLIDNNLVDAQTARRVLDRLVGYKLSPLLWQKVRRGLSAGRVQSVALRLIVEREREIEKFKKEEYFTIHVILSRAKDPSTGSGRRLDSSVSPQNDNVGTQFDLIEINGGKIEVSQTFNLYDGEYKVTKTIIEKEEKAKEIENDLKTKEFIVSDVTKKETRRSPQPPFTTSTLQQEGARRLGFSGKRTMSLAQKLYEEGFITYHRTDSLNVSQSAIFAMRSFVKKEFGEKYIPETPRFYKTKQKSAQEAHEAIRPTNVSNQQSTINNQLGRDYGRLYDLIWKRGVASQMADAITDSTTVIVDSTDDKKIYRLKANGSVLLFEGFLKVNPFGLQDKKLPDFAVSDQLQAQNILAEKHETPPPPRYNDASLVATLEEKDIGRPSTYAAIISTIEARRYIERTEGRFVPTSVGIAVNDFLVENFSDVDDIPFTAHMENKLDDIANGEEKWEPMIKEFYTPFEKKLKEAKDTKRVKIEVEKTDQKCEKCGAPMVVRIGRFGKFLSCSKFPECDFKKAFIEETGFTCPKDGGKVIARRTRKGRTFYGCSNYPACTFAAWKLSDIKKEQEVSKK